MHGNKLCQHECGCDSLECGCLPSGKKGTKKEKLPDAPFRLTSDELKVADKRAGNVQVPVGYGWSPRPLFAKYSYMKSHDWKQVC